MGVRKENNQPIATFGLLTTTAGPDLMHTMPTVDDTTVIIRKIFWYNNTGAQETLIFGTQDNTVGAAWIPLFPTINCVNTMDGQLTELELPEIEFVVDTRAGAAGRTGDILVQATAVGILVRLEVEEFREGR